MMMQKNDFIEKLYALQFELEHPKPGDRTSEYVSKLIDLLIKEREEQP